MTGWNPLTIWVYDEYYVRFGADEFSMENFNNLYSHLTNNSIGKYSSNFEKCEFEGCMWTQKELASFVEEKFGKDSEKKTLRKGIRQIVRWSMESVQNTITPRKNSVELFGYDFMVDDQLKVWLLEINSSPAVDYSTVRLMDFFKK